ncbi:hypothetical protein GS682_09180 [Nostoc sp. B(2019)]|nr:hypothetical protein [Nostoc sp. B(2019)]
MNFTPNYLSLLTLAKSEWKEVFAALFNGIGLVAIAIWIATDAIAFH